VIGQRNVAWVITSSWLVGSRVLGAGGGVWPGVVQLGGGWVRSERWREWFCTGDQGRIRCGRERAVAEGEFILAPGKEKAQLVATWILIGQGWSTCRGFPSLLFVECTRSPGSTVYLCTVFLIQELCTFTLGVVCRNFNSFGQKNILNSYKIPILFF
jgi:hypothetical protein